MSNIVMNNFKRVLSFCLLFSFVACLEDTSRMMVDGKLEPPAPDSSENDKTIGGIDSNNDGVRDDIERWINREFPGEKNYNKRMAWKQRAKSIRDVQINATTEEKAVRYLYAWNDAGVCTSYVYVILNKEGLKEDFRIGDALLEKSNNTKQRLKKWMFADRSFAGHAYTDPTHSKRHTKCKFKIKN